MDAAAQARFERLIEDRMQAMLLHGLRDKMIDRYRRQSIVWPAILTVAQMISSQQS